MKRAVYFTFILIFAVMLSLVLFACNKNEHTHKWGGWYDNGDGKHMRMCLTDSEHVEYEPHEFSDYVVRKEPTDILPGEQTRTCKSCGYTETEVIPPTGDHVFDKEIKDDKYLYKKTSDYSAIYYKSCDCGAFGNPDYLFEDTLLPDGYSDLEYISFDWDGGIDTGIECGQGVNVQYNTCKVRNANIPDGYIQVDYIQSTGTQYIDTGFSTDNGMICEYKANWQTTGYIVGSHNPSQPYGRNGFCLHDVGVDWEMGYGETCNSYSSRYGANLNQDYFITFSTTYDDAYAYVNNQLISRSSGQKTSAATVKLFVCEFNMSRKTSAILYYCKIKNSDGTLVRDFVPCIRISDYAVGMYDVANGKFYENAGEGSFNAGEVLSENKELFVENVALPSEYKRVPCITADGTQYCDTGICLETGDVIITEFENTSGYIIGQNWQGGINPYWQISGNAGSHLIDFSDNKVGDAHIYTFNSVPDDMQATLGIFCTHGIGNPVAFGKGNVYYFQLFRDGEKIMSLVPAVDDKGEAGFFDVVGNLFYTNQGSGNLGYGDKIDPRFNESTYALYYIDADGKKVDTAAVMASDQESFKETYVRCEYIECDGNQWIDSGVIGRAMWIFDVQYTDTTERQLMGHGGTGGEYWGVTEGKYGKAAWNSSDVTIGERDVIQINNFAGTQSAGIGGYVYVNGKFAVDNHYDSKSEEKSATLFAIGDGLYKNHCKLWGCQVYDVNDILIRNFVPCVRKSDGVAGLFDDVTGEFFKSEGTKAFIVGDLCVDSENVIIGYTYNYFVAKYKSMNIYDAVITSDDVTMHLIPALRNSDCKIGMYDIVSGKFFESENDDAVKAGITVTHIYEDDVIIKEATYSEDGLLMRKCEICGTEIYYTIPKTAFKVEFVGDDGIDHIKVMNSLDTNDYQIASVAYSRNVNSYNYSKFNSAVMIEVVLKDGFKLDEIVADSDKTVVTRVGNIILIAGIADDMQVTVSSKKA